MSGEPDLDVVIVTYNSADHVGRALEALPATASTVVVDNGSDDSSVAVARGHGATVIESDVNSGFAASANRGARVGHAELILFLNPDAVIDPPNLRVLASALAREHDVAIVGPSLRTPDGAAQRGAWPYPTPATSWLEAVGLGRLRRDSSDRFVIGAALLVRRHVFEALHGFDERFWLYAEETDLCRRALDAGWRIELVEDARASHIGGASGDDQPELVFEHFGRGLEHYVDKHHGPLGLLSTRAALATGSAIRSVVPGSADRRRHHRTRFRRATRQLRTPTSVALDSPATRAPGKGLVVCSLEAWDEVWRRNQFFVRELLDLDPNRRVLFVEPPYDLVHEARRRSGRRRARGLRPLETDGRVIRFEPVKLLPRALGPWADRGLRRQVRRAADSLGLDCPTLWVNDPSYAPLVTETTWPSVYDITDDWTRAGGEPREIRRVVENERRLFASCDRVVVCSEGLAASRREARPDLATIPNGVDVDEFRRPTERPPDLPPGPTAVYVGTLHEDRLDVDLVRSVATELGDAGTVVLVGPDALPAQTSAQLRSMGNVELLGPRPYRDVPAYLQHADVVIVPHVVSPFTESLDPIKAYECLAVGRPTVATPVAGFRELGEPVVVRDRADFPAAVADLVDRRVGSRPRPVPTWQDRARAFDAELTAARRSAAGRGFRVAYIDHCARLSGAELNLVRVLQAMDGVDATVILGEHGPLEAKLRAVGAAVEVMPLDPGLAATARAEVTSIGLRRSVTAASATVALARRLRRLRPDLVHTNSLKAMVYGGIAGRLAGIPVVWHVHDRLGDDLPPAVVRALQVIGRVVPAAVVANSSSTLATLGPVRRASVVPSPVTRNARPQERPAGSPLRLAMVGRLAPWKGQHVFLRAFADAFGDGDATAMVVGSALFGEDEYASRLEALVDELGLAGRVTFTGFVDDVPALLGDVDILVHASTAPEPFGQVIIEGMAAGAAVVASDAGGPAEIITDGVDGVLVPPDDPAALAHELRALADDPERRRRIADAGYERAGDFAPATVAGSIRSVYARVARRHPR